MSCVYPWQGADRRRLLGLRAHLPHAVLLAGPKGVGKRALAHDWGKTLLCESPSAEGDACNQCQACHWFVAGTHPDWLHLTLEEKETKDGEIRLASEITVDQARRAIEFAQLSSYRGGRRIIYVDPADDLNRAAANAMLKVLEEPPLNTLIILTSHQVRRLLPTLRSRCHRQEIVLPDRELAIGWLREQGVSEPEVRLALAGGAPLVALEGYEGDTWTQRREVLDALSAPLDLDVAAAGERWGRLPAMLWYELSYKWLADLLARAVSAPVRFNPDYGAALTALAGTASLGGLLILSRKHAEDGRWADHPLNRPMQIESWLLDYRGLFEGRGLA
jgi:DNA polymerase III subunit delta'